MHEETKKLVGKGDPSLDLKTLLPQEEAAADSKHLPFRSTMSCELPFQLCFKACRSNLLSACEQRRRSWTSSDKPCRAAASQGPDTRQPATQTEHQHPNSGSHAPNLHAGMSVTPSHFSRTNYLSSTRVCVPSRFRRVKGRADSLSCVRIF